MPTVKKTAHKATKKKAAAKRPAKSRKGAFAVDEGMPAEPGTSTLVVVESPAKAKTIGKYLGRGYRVRATIGHVRDLPEKKIGIDIDNGFEPEYVTIPGKEKTLTELKNVARDSREILLATDPDREGEAIAWHVAGQIRRKGGAPVRRVLFHEITREAVQKAIANAGEIDERKVDAQQARRVLDRLVGYKASPVLWKTIKTGLSAGRVQTVALRLIIEREEEIRKFVPQEYWTVAADLEKDGQAFQARLQKLDGHKPEIKDEATARAIVAEVEKLPFVVTSVSTGERRRKAPAPFTTSTMQQEAAKQLGFSAGRTMRAAQKLYEGVELGDRGSVGLITYMRTDSVRVSDAALKQAREYINAQFDKRYLPDEPNVHKGGRGSKVQDAHEAIRPTEVGLTPEDIKKYLERDLFKLYQLIWRRFLASQMTPAVYEATKVDFDLAKGCFLFRAIGSRVVFDGYHVLYSEAHEPEDAKTLDSLQPIPKLAEGDRATLKQVVPTQHFTEPPPRYSEASLVKELERLGIGRPSTYAAIISTLRMRWYATAKDRRFQPTPQGETVWKVLKRSFPEVFEVGFTAQMENELDKVEDGDLDWQAVLGDFWGPFNRALEAVDINKIIHEVHDLSGLDTEKCPKCGAPLEVRSGRFGPFIACIKYKDKECDFSKSVRKDKVPDRPSDEICKECGAPMVIKTGRFGEFLACTRYPKCKYTQPVPLGITCPKCGVGDLAERRTKRGRTFYGCLRYPDCDYSTWNKPVAVPCPSCGFVGMEEIKSKTTGETTRKCLKCGHQVTVEAEAAEAEEVAS